MVDFPIRAKRQRKAFTLIELLVVISIIGVLISLLLLQRGKGSYNPNMRIHRNISDRARRGFTLIELLVVISIVALLISILLPALAKAKRAGMVIHCASNFRQLGIGLKIYTDQFNHKYPPAPVNVWWSAPLYDTRFGDDGSTDGRKNFMEISNGQPDKLLWCPLDIEEGPIYNGVDEWSRYYKSCGGVVPGDIHCWESKGILIFFLGSDSWNWANSGNPDTNGDGSSDRPTEPDNPQSSVMSDYSFWSPPQCSADGLETVCWSVHTQLYSFGVPATQRFIDANILYGDGRVVTRNRPQNRVSFGVSHLVW